MKTFLFILLASGCLFAFYIFIYKQTGHYRLISSETVTEPTKQPQQKPQKVPEQPAVKLYPTNQTKFVGVLRRVDMLQDQAVRMQLDQPVYIVDTEQFTLEGRPIANHLYLKQVQVPLDLAMELFEGKCVEVDGTLDPLSMQMDGMYYGESVLGGFVLVHPTIAPVDIQKCMQAFSNTFKPDVYETIELEGVISRINRPSADINYDYIIETTSRIPGAQDMSGTGRQITSSVVMPTNFEIYKDIEEKLGTPVKVKGYLQWGYAESQFFTIEDFLE